MEVTHERIMMLDITSTDGKPVGLKGRIAHGHLLPGDLLTIDGTEWLVIDNAPGKALIWQRTNVMTRSEFMKRKHDAGIPEGLRQLAEKVFIPTMETVSRIPQERERIAFDSDGIATSYWLAEPTDEDGFVRFVRPDGTIGTQHVSQDLCIAPACWIRGDTND
uniref:Uncharacterized protein n=1 Tax=uncultured bacterium Contig643 TaxID=1393602 RepID=W0FKP7_9BACT|nr:hypothetical protein [uncultured bacterium Contig643]